MKKTYTITELTNEFDITTRTLRFYESEGLITPDRNGRQRIYKPSDRTRIKLILRAKRLGLSLNEVSEIINLYDQPAGKGEVGQLKMMINLIESRRQFLLQQQQDIEITLQELEDVERGCQDRLTAIENKEPAH